MDSSDSDLINLSLGLGASTNPSFNLSTSFPVIRPAPDYSAPDHHYIGAKGNFPYGRGSHNYSTNEIHTSNFPPPGSLAKFRLGDQDSWYGNFLDPRPSSFHDRAYGSRYAERLHLPQYKNKDSDFTTEEAAGQWFSGLERLHRDNLSRPGNFKAFLDCAMTIYKAGCLEEGHQPHLQLDRTDIARCFDAALAKRNCALRTGSELEVHTFPMYAQDADTRLFENQPYLASRSRSSSVDDTRRGRQRLRSPISEHPPQFPDLSELTKLSPVGLREQPARTPASGGSPIRTSQGGSTVKNRDPTDIISVEGHTADKVESFGIIPSPRLRTSGQVHPDLSDQTHSMLDEEELYKLKAGILRLLLLILNWRFGQHPDTGVNSRASEPPPEGSEGNASEGSSPPRETESGSSTGNDKSGGKRERGGDEEESNDGNDNDPTPPKKKRIFKGIQELWKNLACPFAKGQPDKYANCSLVNRKNLTGVREHLKRKHLDSIVPQKLKEARTWAEIFMHCNPNWPLSTHPIPSPNYNPYEVFKTSVNAHEQNQAWSTSRNLRPNITPTTSSPNSPLAGLQTSGITITADIGDTQLVIPDDLQDLDHQISLGLAASLPQVTQLGPIDDLPLHALFTGMSEFLQSLGTQPDPDRTSYPSEKPPEQILSSPSLASWSRSEAPTSPESSNRPSQCPLVCDGQEASLFNTLSLGTDIASTTSLGGTSGPGTVSSPPPSDEARDTPSPSLSDILDSPETFQHITPNETLLNEVETSKENEKDRSGKRYLLRVARNPSRRNCSSLESSGHKKFFFDNVKDFRHSFEKWMANQFTEPAFCWDDWEFENPLREERLPSQDELVNEMEFMMDAYRSDRTAFFLVPKRVEAH
ncbi:hypothetical protein DRE_00230 [Drechslerella stenobrocha 248]|uniref:Uncharacterized protein n=1 Tax=Drechslerella stenobrocha 248 TaxID=1043628 RepID=W7IHZ8_9PEZI|nr:hypothetical protein DRE_00230 [Drechslerella stenobrocha 248]